MDQLQVPAAVAGASSSSSCLSPSLSRSSSYTHVQHTDFITVMDKTITNEHVDNAQRAPSVRSLNTSIPPIVDGRARASTSSESELRLTEEERRLALMYRNCGTRRSVAPLLFFLAASLGKLILGFGVALAIRGHYSSGKTSFAVGVALAACGFAAVVAAALGFGAAAARVSKKWGIIFKTFSISGGVLIAIGYALNQYFVSDKKPLFQIRLSFIPLAMGTACMGISLPSFFSSYELYAGRVVGLPIRYRPFAALLMMSPSMGSLFAGWVSSEHADWPVAFNAVVLTFVVALGYGGISIFWSEQLRLWASNLEMRLCKEEEEEMREKAPLPRSGTQDSDLSSPTLLGSSTNSNKLPSAAAVV